MAGLVVGAGHRADGAALARSLAVLRHHPSILGRALHVEAGCVVGAVYRRGEPPDVAVDAATGVAVVVTGRPIDPERGRRASAADVLTGFASRGIDHVTGLDGGYVVLVLERRAGRLTVVNDRTATQPMHLLRGDAVVALAPEGKGATALAGVTPRLDVDGALEFLAYGHAIGARTLLAEVELLEPASVVRVDLAEAQAAVRRSWDLGFSDDARRSERQATDDLHERLEASVAAAVDTVTPNTQVLLTGGYDSRTLLAYLLGAGHAPARAVTWGTRDDLAGSDVTIARGLAADAGVPFVFARYGDETFEERARSWTVVSELASDNLGNFAGGPAMLLDGDGEPPLTFIGDHMFGAGGIPLDASDALEAAVGVPGDGSLPVGLRSVLRPAAQADAAEVVHAGVRALVARREHVHPKDLQDYLAYHVRLARWLNAPTYFREPMLAVCRPMVHAPILEWFGSLPPALRVDRRIHVRLLERRFPVLARTPVATVSSLIDWDQAFRGTGPTARNLAGLLEPARLAASPLGPLLDVDAITERRRAFANAPVQRGPERSARWLPRLRRALSRSRLGSTALRHLQRGTTRALGRSVGVSADRALVRIGLLSLLVACIDDGDLAAPAQPLGGPAAAPSWWDDGGRG